MSNLASKDLKEMIIKMLNKLRRERINTVRYLTKS